LIRSMREFMEDRGKVGVAELLWWAEQELLWVLKEV